MDENAKKNPYRGLWVVLTFMLGFPLGVFALLYAALCSFQPTYNGAPNLWCALAIAGIVSVLFHLSLLIAGAFKDAFAAVSSRLRDLFEDMGVSVRLAFRWYWESIKTDGVVFWLMLAPCAAVAAVTGVAIQKCAVIFELW